MALDPKQVIQKNIVLVVCYVVAVVPVILWVLLVVNGVQGGATGSYKAVANQLRSKKNELEKMKKEIEADPALVFTPEHKKKFLERNEELNRQYDGMIKLVADRDNALEKWLNTLGDVPKDKPPGTNTMQTALNTAMDILRKDYKDIAEDSGPSKTSFLQLETVAEGQQKKLQKQYWILARLLEALKKGGTPSPADPVPVRLLSTVEFGQIQVASSAPGPGGAAPPKPLMTAIPVKIVATMTFRDIPKVCRELLAQDIVFRLKSLHTELLPFSIAKPDVGVMVNADPKPLYESTIYNATLANADKKPADEELWFPEPKLKVTIELDAIDLDMEAIIPPAAVAPPAEKQPEETPKAPPKKKKDE